MITEDYVSFEVAKLLKEKGFNKPTCGFYHDNYTEELIVSSPSNHNGSINVIAAPSQAQAMKWLREVHNLSVEVYRTACGYIGCIVAIPSGTDIKFLEDDGDDLPSGQYTTWEKACKAAIIYCLTNLI